MSIDPKQVLESLRQAAAQSSAVTRPPLLLIPPTPPLIQPTPQPIIQPTPQPIILPPTAHTSALETLKALKAAQAESAYIPEIRRITSLPIVPNLTAEQLEAFNYNNTHAIQYQKGWRWHDLQAKAVLSYEKWGGLFGIVGCGWGKTAITLMIAQRAFRFRGIKKTLLLVPPDVYNQLVRTDIPFINERTPLTVPFIKLGRSDLFQRNIAAGSNYIGCYILPYSLLSTKDATDILNAIAPQLIIADEAHTLKNKTAAKTRRLMDYVNANHPEFVALSGTLSTKGIEEYHHLIKACLRENSPLPMTWQEAQDWGIVLDTSSQPSEDQMRPLTPLVSWAMERFQGVNFSIDVAGYRSAYQKRLESAPGVVASGDKELGTSLIIRNTPVKSYTKTKNPGGPDHGREGIAAPGGKRLIQLIDQVEEMKTPNGDEIDYAVHKFKWLYELSAGFYYELTWPTTEKVATDRTAAMRSRLSTGALAPGTPTEFSLKMAEDSLEAARKHHEAVQAYTKELRRFLLDNPQNGMDTPMLVGAEMLRNGPRRVGNLLYGLWMKARSLNVDPYRALGPIVLTGTTTDQAKSGFHLVERQSKPIPICAYKVDAAAQWALDALQRKAPQGENRGAIIWTHHQFIGKWVYHAIKKLFLAQGAKEDKLSDFVVYCPAGNESNNLLTNKENHASLSNKIIVASLAHRMGKNLQFLQRQLFVQWPRSAEWAEQAIARIHRTGQIADEVYVDSMNTTDFDHVVFSACLNDALYTHQTLGSRQKVIYATYNPLPKIFPRAVMIEKGMNPMMVAGEEASKFDAMATE